MSSYKTQKLSVAGLTGPAIGADGTAYIVTGSGPMIPLRIRQQRGGAQRKRSESEGLVYPSAGAKGRTLNAGPVVFTYKDKELIAAPGKDGSCSAGQRIVSAEPIITLPCADRQVVEGRQARRLGRPGHLAG